MSETTQSYFFKVSNGIFLFDLKPRDIAVYGCICRHINAVTGVAFPSRKTIARKCGIAKEETVDRALARLCQLGLIEKYHQYTQNGGYASNIYRVPPIPEIGGEVDT